MRLKLTLVRSDGSSVDIVVEADAAASVQDLARTIADRDPIASTVDSTAPLTLRRFCHAAEPTDPADPAEGDWVLLPPTAQLSAGLLASGALVALADERPDPLPTGRVAVVESRSGGQLGTAWTLGPGTWIVGRDARCDIPLDDRYVSGRHARIEVGDVVSIADLGSANGLEVDGELVGHAEIRGWGVVTIGETQLRISAGPHHASVPTRAFGGSSAFTRAPRVEPRYSGSAFFAPTMPRPKEPSPFPWAPLAAPLLVGVSLAALTGRLVMLWFVLMSPIMLVVSLFVNRVRDRRAHATSTATFMSQLDALGHEVAAARAIERTTRHSEAPSMCDVIADSLDLGPLLWTRRPEHWTFLNVRLGTGNVAPRSSITVPESAELGPELRARLDTLIASHRWLRDAPIVDNLFDAGALGYAGREELLGPIVSAVLAQLVGLHSPAELAIAAIVTPSWGRELDWLKWVPHASATQSPIGPGQHLADSAASSDALLTAIEGLVDARLARVRGERRGAVASSEAALSRGGEVGHHSSDGLASGTKSPIPAMVLVVCADASVGRSRLVRLSERGPDAGVFTIWIASALASLPAACRTVVELDGPTSGAVSFVRLGERIAPVELEALASHEAQRFGRSLAPVSDSGAIIADTSDVPRAVSIAEIVDPQLFESASAVIGRWRENDSIVDRTSGASSSHRPGRLRALVGRGGRDVVALDLRIHGPHALVGGTTGAGKSEFLQTWVLGMATEHSPDRLALLFVDYKGGSAFADCVRLPHCVGLVTDLSPHLVRRALASLRAELRHREQVLRHKMAKDLVELERRGDSDAPPALVLVIDEFAALVRDVPEFVDGVVDIAQRGRSLGIHLIMATQRPAGVINDNLRANTNLRVALRMADASDSNDVLGVPDAAHFDPAIAGRVMVKTGSGRLEIFQAAYSGGWTAGRETPAEVSITTLGFGHAAPWQPTFASGTGPTESGELGLNDQQRLVAAISKAAEVAGIPAPRRPWLDELPAVVDLTDALPHDPLRIPLGLSDDPAHQRRVAAAFIPDRDGHIAFYGTSGSGKSAALRTLAVGSATTAADSPVHVYALDFASGGLRVLEGLPHVGAVIPGDDPARVERLLRMLRGEIEARTERYSAASAANIVEYRKAVLPAPEPRLLLLVDGFAAFREHWELSVGRAQWYDVFRDALAVGRQLGIHVAITVDRPGAVPSSISAVIGRRVVLRLADEMGYGMLGVPKDILDDSSPPGRCIVDGLETQVAVLGNEPLSPDALARVVTELLEPLGTIAPAPPIEAMPVLVRAERMPSGIDGRPVLGVSDETLTPTGFDPSGTLILSGPPGAGRSNALDWLVGSLHRYDADMGLVYFGLARSGLADTRAWTRSATSLDDAVLLAEQLARAFEDGASTRFAIAIESVAEFIQTPADSALLNLVRHAKRNGHLIIAENETVGWSGAWPLLAELKIERRGLLLQPDHLEGEFLLRTPLPRSARSEFPPGRGMYIERGHITRVQIPFTGEPSRDPSTIRPRARSSASRRQ